jgi:catechol 2,3-dioxygenase-like lactoylglutathione lyase family enzyme
MSADRGGFYDAVLFDIGGTLVDEAPPATPVDRLEVRLLPGVLDDLTALARVARLGAVTNTAVMTERDVRSLIEPSGLSALLEVVVTSVDAGVAKPDPTPLLLAIERLDLRAGARVLYVGNAETDRLAAQRAGVDYADVADRGRWFRMIDSVGPVIGELVPMCFVPSSDLDRSRPFYEDALGLPLIHSDGFALVFRVAGSNLRVVAAGEFTPQPFTIMGWEAPDMDWTVDRLTAAGVEFLRFDGMDQDDRGIWAAPNGDRVAWFADPDRNVLSLSCHTRHG